MQSFKKSGKYFTCSRRYPFTYLTLRLQAEKDNALPFLIFIHRFFAHSSSYNYIVQKDPPAFNRRSVTILDGYPYVRHRIYSAGQLYQQFCDLQPAE